MLKRFVVVTAWCGVASAAAWGQSATTMDSGDLNGVNPEWLRMTRLNTAQQIELLSAAYELDEATVAALRAELHHRVVAQVGEERAYQREKLDYVRKAKKLPGRAVPPEERRAFLLRMKAWLEVMPLNERQVAGWLEQRMPPEVAARGRRRLEELWQLREGRKDARSNEIRERSGAKARNAEAQTDEVAVLTREGMPLPGGAKRATASTAEKVDPAQPLEPNKGIESFVRSMRLSPKVDTSLPRSVDGDDEGPQETTDPAERQAKVAPAPPLKDWDKHVAEVAREHAFSETQTARAVAILADMKSRAGQYRRSRARDLAEAELIADAKLRDERLQQLNSSIDAMFKELKARLESLPTAEQKEKAAGAVRAKG